MAKGPFAGRSFTVINDLSLDEQYYLYKKSAEVKKLFRQNKKTASYKIIDHDLAVYLMFFENSTRTKESFRNAAKFHDVKTNIFDANSSSFNKKESTLDTVKMLFGYSMRSIFIIRSKAEGLCKYLEDELGAYAEKIGYDRPVFINAGDGKHEHPTQELLDEFTFMERLEWKRDRIHLAIIGDLFHGRTVHSKADGLRVFNEVHVDLIAPSELELPPYYEEKMLSNGFHIRKFKSIDEYLEQDNRAEMWYFTRLQLERMGEAVKDKESGLRNSVTFRRDQMNKIDTATRFYHPLPRHRSKPVIPNFLDNTGFNGWDEQSINGYFTRVVLLAMLSGRLGADFRGKQKTKHPLEGEFIIEAPILSIKSLEYKVGIKPVETGIVIDHIGKGENPEKIWTQIDKIRRILHLNRFSSHGVYKSESGTKYKGLISLPELTRFNEKELKMLAAIAPGCTLNIINDRKVIKKFRLHMPPRIYSFSDISCKNEHCISAREYGEYVDPEFTRSLHATFICKYCQKEHTFNEIWNL